MKVAGEAITHVGAGHHPTGNAPQRRPAWGLGIYHQVQTGVTLHGAQQAPACGTVGMSAAGRWGGDPSAAPWRMEGKEVDNRDIIRKFFMADVTRVFSLKTSKVSSGRTPQAGRCLHRDP